MLALPAIRNEIPAIATSGCAAARMRAGQAARLVIIGDDPAVLAFGSCPGFLAAGEPAQPACAIVDQGLRGTNGPDVAQALGAGFAAIPEKPLIGGELGDAVAGEPAHNEGEGGA